MARYNIQGTRAMYHPFAQNGYHNAWSPEIVTRMAPVAPGPQVPIQPSLMVAMNPLVAIPAMERPARVMGSGMGDFVVNGWPPEEWMILGDGGQNIGTVNPIRNAAQVNQGLAQSILSTLQGLTNAPTQAGINPALIPASNSSGTSAPSGGTQAATGSGPTSGATATQAGTQTTSGGAGSQSGSGGSTGNQIGGSGPAACQCLSNGLPTGRYDPSCCVGGQLGGGGTQGQQYAASAGMLGSPPGVPMPQLAPPANMPGGAPVSAPMPCRGCGPGPAMLSISGQRAVQNLPGKV